MRILVDAAEAVQKKMAVFLVYAAATTGASLLQLAYSLAKKENLLEGLPAALNVTLHVFFAVLLTVVFAVAQAVAFSRIGRDLDKPLWKMRDDAEALRRFFLLWLLLNALSQATLALLEAAGAAENAGLFLFLFWGVLFPISVLYIPCGACIMFHGGLTRNSIGDVFGPLGRQLPSALALILVNVLLFGLWTACMTAGRGAVVEVILGAALFVINAYCECLVFSGTWLLCMVDRDTVDETDFDF